MKKIILKILLVADILAFIIYFVCSQLLVKYDTVSGVMTDGFDRVLTEAPLFFRVPGLAEEWAGLRWFVADAACAFVLIVIAYLLLSKITGKK